MLRSLVFVLALVASASAQPMRTEARPVAGSLSPGDGTLETSIQVRATTEIPVADCVGYVQPSAPDAAVDWEGGDLEISVAGALDATLAVYRPDGTWACDDDTKGSLPVVALEGAPAGRYVVWVGSFAPDPDPTTLTLTVGAPPPRPVLAPGAPALSGRIAAAGGFESRHGGIEVTVRAGGSDAAAELDLDDRLAPEESCIGFVDAAQPTAVVAYDAAGGTGALGFSAYSADIDLVMVVHAPDGTVRCNDDYGDSNPALGFEPAASGDYAVWVGTFSRQRGTVGATLTISEDAPVADWIGEDGIIDEPGDFGPFSEGSYVLLDLAATPASRIRATADEGGSAEVSLRPEAMNPVSGASCVGFVELAPTAAIELSGRGPFALTARADADLTLTVRTPSGGWFCSDDADGYDPGIQIDEPEVGAYLAWVGVFGETEGAVRATLAATPGELQVSELSVGPDRYDGPTQSPGTDAEGVLSGDRPAARLAFEGERVEREVTAGGPRLNPVRGEVCGGFLDDRPTLAVTSQGAFSILASGDQDLTLTILAPDGTWTCSDDALGTNPRVLVDGEAGTYAVWVGTFYRRTEAAPATVVVDEAIPLDFDLDEPPPAPPVIRG